MAKKENKMNYSCYAMMPPRKLRAHPLNHKYFGKNDSRYAELFGSIKTNGFLPQYPVTSAKGANNLPVIICGHRRWKIACDQNITEIPVIMRQDIQTDSSDAERIMIEDNLCRPLEGREFTDLERYMLALELDNIGAKSRGGDRRSESFLNSEKGKHFAELKSKKILGIVGMSPRYLSMLSVTCNSILKDLQQSSPDMLECHSVYDQLKMAIDNNLSEDLTALARAEVPVYKVYRKHKKGNKPQTQISQGDIQVTENEKDITFNNVVASLLKYFESQFDDKDVFAEAAEMLSEMPEGQAKQLKLLDKALNLVMQKMKMIRKSAKKKGIVELQLFEMEETCVK